MVFCFREAPLVRGHVSVSLLGFCLDAALLHLCLAAGLTAAAARLISLLSAMQATFALNGAYVFRRLSAAELPRQWLGYMGCNGLGNLANYALFVGLVASRAPLVSRHLAALAISSLLAWTINYCGARLVAFGAPAVAPSQEKSL
jgi:putative flippase GtrA